jgi:hypothetical protein
MFDLWVHGYPLGKYLSFGYMLIVCSFGFEGKVIWDEKREVCIAQRYREELWREYSFLTTTTTTTTLFSWGLL